MQAYERGGWKAVAVPIVGRPQGSGRMLTAEQEKKGSAQESVKQRDFRGICLRAGIGYSSADARQRLDTGIGLAWVQGLPA